MAKFSYEEFVQVWQEGTSIDEVAQKLGVHRNTVENTRTKLRKKGVVLKAYSSGADNEHRGDPDVSALNALIEKIKPRFADGQRVLMITEHGDRHGTIQHYAGGGSYFIRVDKKFLAEGDLEYVTFGEEDIKPLQQELPSVA